jgi:hypothetical protein
MNGFHEFQLPHVDFGTPDLFTDNGIDGPGRLAVRDRIEFHLGGVPWTLRKLLRLGDEAVTAPEAFAAVNAGAAPGWKISTHARLQVSSDHLSATAASHVAEDICWLLQLPMGQTVTWQLLRHQQIDHFPGAPVRGVLPPSAPSKNKPMPNSDVVKLATYLENAYPIFLSNADWWRVTLDWFATMQTASAIQPAGLLGSMLLERCTELILMNEKYPEQIAPGVAAKLSSGAPERKRVKAKLDAVFREELTPEWADHRTEAILSSLKGWNAAPPYKKRISIAFERFGLAAPPRSMLENRDRLVHGGTMHENTTDLSEYYAAVSSAVIALLGRMLGYKGGFYVLGKGHVEPVAFKK